MILYDWPEDDRTFPRINVVHEFQNEYARDKVNQFLNRSFDKEVKCQARYTLEYPTKERLDFSVDVSGLKDNEIKILMEKLKEHIEAETQMIYDGY